MSEKKEKSERGCGVRSDKNYARIRVDFHLQKIFRGQERNGAEKLMSMRLCHVNRKIFRSVLFRGKLNQVQRFLSYDLSSQLYSFVA